MKQLFLGILIATTLATGANAFDPSFLNSTETFMPNKKVDSWNLVYAKATTESMTECTGFHILCILTVRNQYMDRLKGKSQKMQLEDVNHYYNGLSYRTDDKNYQKVDYWASPSEFLQRGGDCEDYAIAKFFSLRRLGWASNVLRVVVVFDKELKSYHAVLMAWLEGQWYALDNMNFGIVPDGDERLEQYEPVYSVNEYGMWTHQING